MLSLPGSRPGLLTTILNFHPLPCPAGPGPRRVAPPDWQPAKGEACRNERAVARFPVTRRTSRPPIPRGAPAPHGDETRRKLGGPTAATRQHRKQTKQEKTGNIGKWFLKIVGMYEVPERRLLSRRPPMTPRCTPLETGRVHHDLGKS